MIRAVVVGYGMAGRHIHLPLLRRRPAIQVNGIVARDATIRAEAEAREGVIGYPDISAAVNDRDVDLIVIATPHDTHAYLAVEALRAGKHCVVDKVMALSPSDADRMIAARDESGKMLSIFHNRRWDWDFATVRSLLASGAIGRPLLLESSVCRPSPPRTWRGRSTSAGTILHDWGAHFVDQALNLGLGLCRRVTAWIAPAPWRDVDSGGHGMMVMEFDAARFTIESSRIRRTTRPRWLIEGTKGSFSKSGIDPQEDALRSGNLDAATEAVGHVGTLVVEKDGSRLETSIPTLRASWDSYYANIVEHLEGRSPLAVTAEEGREVVRILEAARISSDTHQVIEGLWGRVTENSEPGFPR